MADDARSSKRIRLTGERFKGGRLPVDSLVELQKYQAAVRLVAEQEWMRDHPKEPLPPGFDDSLALTIERIEDGSADVFLAFEQVSEHREYIEQAQDAVDEQIAAAYSGQSLPDLPPGSAYEIRSAIAEIGSTLAPDQAIEFYVELEGEPAVAVEITPVTREDAGGRLVLSDDFFEAPTLAVAVEVDPKQMTVVGRVTRIDADKHRFTLDTDAYGPILAHYKTAPETLADLKKVLDEAEQGPLTRVTGEMRFKAGEPWRFWETTAVDVVEFDDTEGGVALSGFATLVDGWAGGRGVAITSDALEAAHSLLRLLPEDDPTRTMAPTPEGGVQFEWISNEGIRAVEVLDDGSFELFEMRANDRVGTLRPERNRRAVAAFVTGETS
ncbi:hypothetical protein [Agrococcus jejuensis]|uniref:Uncharacterized protein n=1 Tax=Agrococcus jejuensis TaxID=399736 RepID=A0A1G8BY83_9MICO|nr:hypothetical protein [Agrococcus jejuensis]SDH38029.1 hypothetical protein SAMN04489720_1094 [Agrococcus jejuensis]